MKTQNWIGGILIASSVIVIGCGGNGNGVFSTTTSTAGQFDSNQSRTNTSSGQPGAVAPAMAGDEIIFAEIADDGTLVNLLNPASKNTSSVVRLDLTQSAYAQAPTGNFVAFAGKTPTGWAVYSNTTTSVERAIQISPANLSSIGSIQWAPDGKRLLVTGTIGSDPSCVYVASNDGKYFRKLDEGDDASLSPNGKTIVYSRSANGKSAIYTRGIEGKGDKKITDGSADDLLPQWSKDGKRVLFTSNRGGNFGLYVVGAGGGKPVKLYATEGTVYGGTFSTDGKRIAFSQVGKTADETGIFTSKTDGKEKIRLFERPSVVGPVYWTTGSVAPGKSASQPGSLAGSMSTHAKTLLRLPEIKAPALVKPEAKPETKSEEKPAENKAADKDKPN